MSAKPELEKRKAKTQLRGGPSQTNNMDRYTQPKGSPNVASRTTEELGDDSTAQSELTLVDIKGAIDGMKTSIGQQYETLAGKLDAVAVEVNLIRADLSKTNERVQSLDIKTSSLTTDVSDLQTEVRNLRSSCESANRRLDDMDNRARRNNVRLIGVPETTDMTSTDLFVEDIVLNHLAPKGLSKFFAVERAYRVPGGLAKVGAAPRPIIARLFNFRDRDAILQASRVNGPLKYENASLNFYPDFTQSVQRQRMGFQGVKRRLRDKGLKYAMLFPSRLRVEYEGRTFFFDLPDSASDWLDSLPKQSTGRGSPGGAEGGVDEP